MARPASAPALPSTTTGATVEVAAPPLFTPEVEPEPALAIGRPCWHWLGFRPASRQNASRQQCSVAAHSGQRQRANVLHGSPKTIRIKTNKISGGPAPAWGPQTGSRTSAGVAKRALMRPIQRRGHQHLPALLAGGVDNQTAVGANWGFHRHCIGQNTHATRGQLHQ